MKVQKITVKEKLFLFSLSKTKKKKKGMCILEEKIFKRTSLLSRVWIQRGLVEEDHAIWRHSSRQYFPSWPNVTLGGGETEQRTK